MVNPLLLQVNHGDDERTGERLRSIEEPIWTASTYANMALAEPVVEAIRDGQLDPRRLVIIDDALYQLDIRFRMLTNRELARAMSFDDEEAQYEFVGTVSEVTKQIGNAVPVRTATALVRAILQPAVAAPQTEAAS
jgi:site-specific DNA-cytosine methylase